MEDSIPDNIKVTGIEYIFIPTTIWMDGPVYEYEPSYSIEIFLANGYSTIVENIKSLKCISCFKDGYYQPYSTGDIDGWEHRCDRCGAQIWDPRIHYGRK